MGLSLEHLLFVTRGPQMECGSDTTKFPAPCPRSRATTHGQQWVRHFPKELLHGGPEWFCSPQVPIRFPHLHAHLLSNKETEEGEESWSLKVGNAILAALFPHPTSQWALEILGDVFEASWDGTWKAEEEIGELWRQAYWAASEPVDALAVEVIRSLDCWLQGTEDLTALFWGGQEEPHKWSLCITPEVATTSAKAVTAD